MSEIIIINFLTSNQVANVREGVIFFVVFVAFLAKLTHTERKVEAEEQLIKLVTDDQIFTHLKQLVQNYKETGMPGETLKYSVLLIEHLLKLIQFFNHEEAMEMFERQGCLDAIEDL